MGRPKVPENEKLRSFPIRLAPRSLGRQLILMQRLTGRAQQEILRAVVEEGLEREYDKLVGKGADLPPIMKISSMSDEEFRKWLGGAPKPGPKLGKRPHVGA